MPENPPGLSVQGFRLKQGKPAFDEHFDPGRIIGLAGLDGHGQDLLLDCLAGLRRPVEGRVCFTRDGHSRTIGRFRQAAEAGIAYLSRDRRAAGIFPNLSVLDNFGISTIGRDLCLFFLSPARRHARYETFRKRLSIAARDPEASITTLSGGNQQKILLARLLARDPSVLLLNDPTRGVDVATRRILYEVFRQLAANGMTLVVLSSEMEEVIAISDRVLVFRDMELSARLEGDDLNSRAVISAMFGKAA